MNITLTADDIIAAVTVGGAAVSPVLGYIRFVHNRQSAAWREIDALRAEVSQCWKREEHERFRIELKTDLKELEDSLIREMGRLLNGHKGG